MHTSKYYELVFILCIICILLVLVCIILCILSSMHITYWEFPIDVL